MQAVICVQFSYTRRYVCVCVYASNDHISLVCVNLCRGGSRYERQFIWHFMAFVEVIKHFRLECFIESVWFFVHIIFYFFFSFRFNYARDIWPLIPSTVVCVCTILPLSCLFFVFVWFFLLLVSCNAFIVVHRYSFHVCLCVRYEYFLNGIRFLLFRQFFLFFYISFEFICLKNISSKHKVNDEIGNHKNYRHQRLRFECHIKMSIHIGANDFKMLCSCCWELLNMRRSYCPNKMKPNENGPFAPGICQISLKFTIAGA